MRAFPMFIRTTDRRVVIAGGGEQAAQKARLILKTDAELVLCAPAIDAELQALVTAGRARHEAGPITPDSFAGAALVFVASGCPGVDFALHALAREAGALVNVVDQPELCDATTPSIVDRDPVVVAIGTEGTAPVLSRQIKTGIEQMLPPRLGALAALAGRLRAAVAANLPRPARRAFWVWVFGGAPARLHRTGAEEEAARLIKAAIAARQGPAGAGEGMISVVGAGPSQRDLMTLRAVERLQEADIIYCAAGVDPDVLELARRDAERVFAGAGWPEARTGGRMVADAKAGKRVVHLVPGSPDQAGPGAAAEAGIPVEIVPGVSAGVAGAAAGPAQEHPPAAVTA